MAISGPNPLEVARIDTTEGFSYTDWESVWVQHRWADSSPLFRFTCAERVPIPDLWTQLQFRPGDGVDIYLGGQLALAGGIITDRQVAYDATSHGVQLSGRAALPWNFARSSVDIPPGSFDNMSVQQIAQKLAAK